MNNTHTDTEMVMVILINLKCSFNVMNKMSLCPYRYGVGSFNFASLISGTTKTFSTESELEQVCILYCYTNQYHC